MTRLALVAVAVTSLAGCADLFNLEPIGPVTARPDSAIVPDAPDRAADLVVWFPMDTLIGGATPDLVGGRDATCETDNTCPLLEPGTIDGALRFFEAGQILRVPMAAELETTTGFTVAVWIRRDVATAGYGCFVGKLLGTDNDNSWQLCTTGTNIAYVATETGGGSTMLDAPSGAVGTWFHVAVTYNGNGQTLWIDGTPLAQGTGPIEFDGSAIVIGSDIDFGVPGASFVGAIDDLRIYDRPLDPDEVAALAAPGL